MLTDAAIRQAIKNKRNTTLKDGKGRGTGRLVVMVRVMPGRILAEFYAQQWANGKRRMAKIGTFPDMPLADARAKFLGSFASVIQSGQNIKVNRTIKPGTVRDLFDGYTAHLKANDKPSAGDIKQALNRIIGNLDPDRLANKIRTEEITAAIRPIFLRGSVSMADHVRAYVRSAFRWGQHSDNDYRRKNLECRFHLESNPADAIPTEARRAGKRWLEIAEMRALWHWADGRYDTPEMHLTEPTNLAALRLCLLLGQRVQEISTLHADYYNNGRGFIEWPKTKMKREHVLPLPEQAIKILHDMKPNKYGWYFPMQKDPTRHIPHDIINSITDRYVEKYEVEHFTPRDLRRTWKTQAGFAGITKEVRDLLQNHARGDVSSKHYDRYEYLPEKRAGMKVWETWFRDNVERQGAP